jgi:hypothetical protein
MIDAVALGRRRPGGQPKSKDQKRIAVSLRLSPTLHARLVAKAKEHGRSITQQAEMLLDQALSDAVFRDELIGEIRKRSDEMRNWLDEQRAEVLKQHDEQRVEMSNILRDLDEREARARRDGLFRGQDERGTGAPRAQELKRKRKP